MSLKSGIEQECKNCTYDQTSDGSWRQQIKGCSGSMCELYGVRPLPIGDKHEVVSSRRKAVDAQCKACIYDVGDLDAVGTWRQQVRDCKSTGCGIYNDRPMPISGNEIEILELH
jgi:predicted secreted protein